MKKFNQQRDTGRTSGSFQRFIMHKFSIAIFLLFIALSGFAQTNVLEKRISITFNGLTLQKALDKLAQETDIPVAYNSKINILNEKVNKQYKNKSLIYILDDLLLNKDLNYKLIGNKITIYNVKNRKTNISISGYIYDAQTGEALIGCNVYDKASLMGTSSNQFGYYNLMLPNKDGPKEIVFSFLGFEKQLFVLNNKDTLVNIHLQATTNELESVVVRATQDENIEVVRSSEMSTVQLNAKEIKSIPAIAGETDLLKAITVLPGIKPGVDGSSGFYVRGGSIDQNLILLDGVPIYNPYHMWGYLSSFNADAINNVVITKGAFPARYGGRLSSVVDITMKEGNNQEWTKDFTIGLLSAKASVSGPLVKDKSAIMFTARRTYADLIIVPILNSTNSIEGYTSKEGYNFTDLNLKLNYKISDRDRLYFSGLYSRDKYYSDKKEDMEFEGIGVQRQAESTQGWGNAIAALRWNHLFKKNIFVNTTAYFSSYKYYTTDFNKQSSNNPAEVEEQESSVEYISDITDFAIKQDYQFFPSNKHSIRFGASGIYHKFRPGVNSFYSKTEGETIDNTSGSENINGTEISIYIEDDWEISNVVRVNGGLHVSSFFVQGENYFSVQPRISARLALSDRVSLKAGYAHMTQYMHLLTSSGITQSSDLWVPVTKNVKPQQSRQLSVGSAVAISKMYLLEVEGYYKTMSNVIEYKDGASFLLDASGWEDKIATGDGQAYGVEIFFKKTQGKFTGFVGYTLSWSWRQFEEINFGNRFPFRYDRRHDISLVGKYRFNQKWSMNANWVFYTGNAVTVPTSSYIIPNYNGNLYRNQEFPSPGLSYGYPTSNGIVVSAPYRNNYRLPNYSRLDVTASYRKTKKWGEWELTFGITNLYNKMNASFYYMTDEFDLDTGEIVTKYYQKTLFPIMPTLSYSVKF
jgi:outer membrane receptor for ferrienterochelin and colicin